MTVHIDQLPEPRAYAPAPRPASRTEFADLLAGHLQQTGASHNAATRVSAQHHPERAVGPRTPAAKPETDQSSEADDTAQTARQRAVHASDGPNDQTNSRAESTAATDKPGSAADAGAATDEPRSAADTGAETTTEQGRGNSQGEGSSSSTETSTTISAASTDAPLGASRIDAAQGSGAGVAGAGSAGVGLAGLGLGGGGLAGGGLVGAGLIGGGSAGAGLADGGLAGAGAAGGAVGLAGAGAGVGASGAGAGVGGGAGVGSAGSLWGGQMLADGQLDGAALDGASQQATGGGAGSALGLVAGESLAAGPEACAPHSNAAGLDLHGWTDGPTAGAETPPGGTAPDGGNSTGNLVVGSNIGQSPADVLNHVKPATNDLAAAAATPVGANTGVNVPSASGAPTSANASQTAVPPSVPDQLGVHLRALAGARAGTHVMSVALDPQNLGDVRIVAHIAADQIRIDLAGATDATRNALRAALEDLRRDLQSAGMNAELGLGDGGRQSQSETQTGSRNGLSPGQNRTATSPTAGGSPTSGTGSTPNLSAHGLDLIV